MLLAYRSGIFPMPLQREGVTAWWSPDPRAVIPLDGLYVSRSLRKSIRRFDIRIDTAFDAVVDGCADPTRTGRWITDDIRRAYLRLHELGWAHSIEAWSIETGALAGGLYGIAVGGLFAGESMFHRVTDASKAALVALVDFLRGDGVSGAGRLLDVQWQTSHLASLGAIEIARDEYLRRLTTSLSLALPPVFA
ncbi:MAG TPA: leucyl/phenylalanyl-tRNA--protein transferase [Acidimicrobiales bacterium]|nr:leucyl/phenylalanyl-tRNA--protein transferase [Acidimicrobiales bacterium]